jgi:hypothetical protein
MDHRSITGHVSSRTRRVGPSTAQSTLKPPQCRWQHSERTQEDRDLCLPRLWEIIRRRDRRAQTRHVHKKQKGGRRTTASSFESGQHLIKKASRTLLRHPPGREKELVIKDDLESDSSFEYAETETFERESPPSLGNDV